MYSIKHDKTVHYLNDVNMLHLHAVRKSGVEKYRFIGKALKLANSEKIVFKPKSVFWEILEAQTMMANTKPWKRRKLLKLTAFQISLLMKRSADLLLTNSRFLAMSSFKERISFRTFIMESYVQCLIVVKFSIFY